MTRRHNDDPGEYENYADKEARHDWLAESADLTFEDKHPDYDPTDVGNYS